MKHVLVIGSAVVDIIINVDHLPGKEEDVHTISQKISLGGCAYNTSDMIRHFGVPYIPFFPVGTGIYGDFVRARFLEQGIHSPIPTPAMDNGCCYCLVEADGERTFISHHGAEYRFQRDWFDLLDSSSIDTVYICGLEIEEPTGENIVNYLEQHPEYTVFFAPGPRLGRIERRLMQRIFSLHPILHLNEDEALAYCCACQSAECYSDKAFHDSGIRTPHPHTKTSPAHSSCAGEVLSLQKSAEFLYQQTENSVIITLGDKGCYLFENKTGAMIPPVSAHQIDTIGAGDAHIGAVIAGLKLGKSLTEAIAIANRISARVVEIPGALLSEEEFRAVYV